jgi:hypothetical protein
VWRYVTTGLRAGCELKSQRQPFARILNRFCTDQRHAAARSVAELDAVDDRLDEFEVFGQAGSLGADLDGDVAAVVVEEVDAFLEAREDDVVQEGRAATEDERNDRLSLAVGAGDCPVWIECDVDVDTVEAADVYR